MSRALRFGAVLATVALITTGCGRDEISVYEAPKDAPQVASNPHGGSMATPEAAPPRPGITWTNLPAGWTSRGASGMRAANFTIEAATGTADLAVIPLPGTGGSDVDLVNLWRGQLALSPIEPAQLPAHTSESTIGGETVKLFHIVGSEDAQAPGATNQIVVAALRKSGFTWFFKLAGPAPVVDTQRDALKSFLAAVQFSDPQPSTPPSFQAAATAQAPSSNADAPVWQVPEDWERVPPTQMIHSKWKVSAPSGESADVTVSVFPGETGGLVANLNRWRSQVGLQPAADQELTSMADNLDVMGGKATLVEFSGSGPEDGKALSLIGAVVRRGGQTWFYKVLGPAPAVAAHRDGFIRFVQTVRYP